MKGFLIKVGVVLEWSETWGFEAYNGESVRGRVKPR